MFSLVAALAAAAIAKKTLNSSWRAATGKNPPENPADPDVDVWEAVLWAAVSGTVIGLARMLANARRPATTRGPRASCRPSSSRATRWTHTPTPKT